MTFTLPPEGFISEQVVLADHGLALGLQHKDGAAVRVVVWNGDYLRHMSRAAAQRFARDLAAGEHADDLRPVIEALDRLVARVVELETVVASLDLMAVEGHA